MCKPSDVVLLPSVGEPREHVKRSKKKKKASFFHGQKYVDIRALHPYVIVEHDIKNPFLYGPAWRYCHLESGKAIPQTVAIKWETTFSEIKLFTA